MSIKVEHILKKWGDHTNLNQIKIEALKIIDEFIATLDPSGPFGDEHFKMFVIFTSIKDKIEKDEELDNQEIKEFTGVIAEQMKTDYETAEEEGYESLLKESFQLSKYGYIFEKYCLL